MNKFVKFMNEGRKDFGVRKMDAIVKVLRKSALFNIKH